jgi:hypothetical protein
MNRLLRAIPPLCLAALASCAYFDPVNPPDPALIDKDIGWQAHLESGVGETAYCVQPAADGGFVILGTVEGDTEAADLWLFKTDADGRKQWSRTFGGASRDIGRCLRPAPDGGFLLVGSTRSLWEASGWDVYLVRTDADGGMLWETTFGGSADDYGWSLECTGSDGACIIAGGTWSYGAGDSDLYLIKADAGGNPLWEKTIGGPCFEEGYAVRQTPDGGFIIAGCTQASFDSDDNAWLVKTDANGNREWDRVFGTIATSLQDIPGCLEQARDVQSTAEGGFLVAGYRHPSATEDCDAWLIKTDAGGIREWDRTFGGTGWDQAEAVVCTADGGYALAGMSRSYGAWEQAWLLKTNPDGIREWDRSFGEVGDEWGYCLLQTAGEGYLLAGSTTSYGGQQAYLVYYKPWTETQ